MGPILKTLFGLFLIVWIAIGIAVIAGGTVLTLQLPRLVNQAQTSLTALLPGQPSASASSSPDQSAIFSCATKSISPTRLTQIQNGSQPTARERQTLSGCGVAF